MKTRLTAATILAFVVTLIFAWVVLAQGPEPSGSARNPEGDQPFANPASSGNLEAEGLSPTGALGQPGLSYRYDRTYGATLVPYLADTSHLFRPRGVAVDGAGNVYIGEGIGHRMLKYAPDGTYLMSIGQAGVGLANKTNRLGFPVHLAVESGGSVWIVENWANRVSKWSSTGVYLSQLGTGSSGSGNDRLNNPEGVALDEARGRIYVADTGVHRVQVFTTAGVYSTTLGVTKSCGTAASQFCYPRGVAVDGSGRVYVADSNNHRVQVFDSDLNYLTTLNTTGTYGSANNQFNTPYDVEIGPDGSLYVADRNNSRVQVISAYPALAYLATLGQGHCGSESDHFCNPDSVAVTAAGTIYVADESNMRVQAFSSGRVYQRTFGVTGVPYLTDNQHFETPVDVSLDASGNLVVLEYEGQRFVKLTPDGTALFSVGTPGANGGSPNRFCWPSGVATDGAGRIYVADDCNNYVQVYDSNGMYLANLGTGYGTGDKQFKRAYGVTVAADGKVYVADRDSHRVQVYGTWPAFTYLGTLGVTGVSGTGPNNFNSPNRVAVDATGNIYVADTNNHRVQKCTLGGGCTTFAGVTGSSGSDFGRLNSPTGIAVDSQRVYVVDKWNYRVQVFDLSGAYLTTIGGAGGQNAGRLQEPWGVAVDGAGNVYVTEYGNHRVQRFVPGVPGWVQTNINGFGDRPNQYISALGGFGGQLYAGTENWSGNGAQIWRASDGLSWTPVMTDGFGITRNIGIDHLFSFDDQLYAGTWSDPVNGGEVWRSSDGLGWTRVVSQGFGDPDNGEVVRFAAFSNTLYASTWSYTTTRGLEIWRSSTGDSADWTRVVSNGFNGNIGNIGAIAMEVFNGYLYVGTYNWNSATITTTGGEVWRTNDGATWLQVNTSGFGTVSNGAVTALAAFDGSLYAASYSQVWSCQVCDNSDWTKVVDNGFGNTATGGMNALEVFDNNLYFVVANSTTGMQVWRTATGTNWVQVGFAGFGDTNNLRTYWDNATTVFSNRLYIGTGNSANGGEIWKKTVTAGFTASPVAGPPPLNVSFANQSTGDVTTTLWDFGDGVTSTAISPTHEYTRTGVYTVTLTVGDGVDTNVVTRTAYVRVGYRLFLPLVVKTYDGLLYDDFGDPVYDGFYHPGKWQNCGTTGSRAWQQAGTLVITNTTLANAGGGCLRLAWPAYRTLAQMQVFEAKLKLSSDQSGSFNSVHTHVSSNAPGHGWFAECNLGANAANAQASYNCFISYDTGGGSYFTEYSTPGYSVPFDTWVTARMEVDPATANFRFYMNGSLIGSRVPSDAAALITATDLQPNVSAWTSDLNATGTKYVDDVRITLAQP